MTVAHHRSVYKALGLPHYGTVQKVAKEHGTTFAQIVRDEADARSRPNPRQ
jgi:hypothetical protein